MLRKVLIATFLMSTLSWIQIATAQTVIIKSDHETVARIITDTVSIRFQDNGSTTRLKAACKKNKCQFRDSHNTLVAEVKYYSDKLKLRTTTPSTEIKFKGDRDKRKVVVNGDEAHPLVIKPKSDKLKVYQVNAPGSESELGQIQLAPDNNSLKVKTADKDERYRIKDSQLRPVYGVLLDNRLQPLQRYVLIAAELYRPLP